ncbi:MAG TPA: phosphoribosyltransferase family protein [Planctomycetota bacterium]|nr:phosphoribosyltransferase family protein [Planctomycetota bacterium]
MFRNRTEAGRQLAGHLQELAGPDALVLAIPRGGVVVGAAIAAALQCELDVINVRKLGAPFNPELAIGSIMEGAAEPYLNEQIISDLAVPADYIRDETERQRKEAERRAARYRNGRRPARIKDRTVILTDDGLATGATMISSIHGVKAQQPARLIVALPVGPADTIERIGRMVDDVLCLACPPFFGAVGQFYADFAQTSDEEVVELLEKLEKATG